MKLILLFLAVVLLSGPWSALALEIIYPADQTSIVRSNYLILKGGEPMVEAIDISVNGHASGLIDISDPEYREAFQDMVILEPEFDPGKNTIKVDGYAAGKKIASASADIYLLGLREEAPKGFPPFVMHLPAKEALCAPCHNMKPSADELRRAGPDNPCAACHRKMTEEKHVHGPVGVYQCLDCHDGASTPARYRAPVGDGALCNPCHFDKAEQFAARKFIHGPVQVGQCQWCHDPHGSAHPAQMVQATNDLCLQCHEPIGKSTHVVRGVGGQGHPLTGVRNPLNAERPFSCAACHDPHAGAVGSLLAQGQTGRFALCQLCHKK